MKKLQPTMVLPVRRSIVQPDALIACVLDHFGLNRPVTCKLLAHGHDDLYRIEDAQGKFVLRVYAHGNRRIDLEAQADILETMITAGPPAVRPFKGNCGYVMDVPALEGLRYAMLYAHATGMPAGRGITRQQAAAYGQLVAKLHYIADASDAAAPLKIDLAYLLDEPMRIIRSVLQHRLDDIRWLEQTFQSLKREVAKLPTAQPTFGLCHGDLHKTNILVDQDGRLTLIDWDCVGMGWRAYDVAVLRWSIGPAVGKEGIGEPLLSKVWDAYLDGYLKLRPMSEQELAAIPLFVAARHIRVMGWEIDRAVHGIDGIGMLTEVYFDWWIEGVKSWVQLEGFAC